MIDDEDDHASSPVAVVVVVVDAHLGVACAGMAMNVPPFDCQVEDPTWSNVYTSSDPSFPSSSLD